MSRLIRRQTTDSNYWAWLSFSEPGQRAEACCQKGTHRGRIFCQFLGGRLVRFETNSFLILDVWICYYYISLIVVTLHMYLSSLSSLCGCVTCLSRISSHNNSLTRPVLLPPFSAISSKTVLRTIVLLWARYSANLSICEHATRTLGRTNTGLTDPS